MTPLNGVVGRTSHTARTQGYHGQSGRQGGSNPSLPGASGLSVAPQFTPLAMPWFMCSPWVPRFTGEVSGMGFGEWRTQIEAILRAQGLVEQQQTDLIMGALDGRAKREAMLFSPEQKHSPASLWTALQGRFGSLRTGWLCQGQIHALPPIR